MSWNLRNKDYYFMNEKCSPVEYEKKIAQYDLSTLEGQKLAKRDFESLKDKFIVKAFSRINCENCYGDYLVGCKDCKHIYFSDGCRDSKSILRGTEDINSFDCVVGGKIELCYNLLQPGWCYRCAFTISCNRCNDTYFSETCDDCNECLGCISLKRGKFCIFNKKYSEEEYYRLKNLIFNELKKENSFDEFFNPEKSPFEYEETIADLYFPKVTKKHNGDLVEGKCVSCGRGLQVSEAERNFYEKMKLAIPEKCFYCNILALARPYSVVILQAKKCLKCGETVFSGRKENIYCEKCYLGEVY